MKTRSVPAALAVVLALTLAAPRGAAQQGGGASQACAPENRVGSLGISGLRMERGTFERTESGYRARFYTEPVVTAVSDHGQGGDGLQEGDVLVALDGRLITTRAGGERYSSLRPGERVRVRVRREGRERELEVVAGRRCVPPPPPAPRAPTRPSAGRTPDAPAPPAAGTPSTSGTPVAPRPLAPTPEAPRGASSPRAPAPPPPPPEAPPHGSFGFSFRCSDCGMRREPGADGAWDVEWFFTSPPEITAVEPGSPAALAGLRRGDHLTHIDGSALTTADGGRRLAAVKPGDSVRWTFDREGRSHAVVMVARASEGGSRGVGRSAGRGRAPAGTPPLPGVDTPAAPGPESPLRYSGRAGPALVEVRGAPVNVLEDTGTGEIVIRSGDVWVRIRILPQGGDGGSP